jgi:hypothetical protein
MDIRNNKSFVFSCILFFMVAFLSACASPHVRYSKPEIEENPFWEIHEECGYENCYPLVDFLVGEGIKIRLESFNGNLAGDVFEIYIVIITDKKDLYHINPSNIYIKLANNDVIYAKPIDCSRSDEEIKVLSSKDFNALDYLRSAKPIIGEVAVSNGDVSGEKWHKCIELFFDIIPPPAEEEFYLMLDGLSKNGVKVKVPKIHFMPSTRRGGAGKALKE